MNTHLHRLTTAQNIVIIAGLALVVAAAGKSHFALSASVFSDVPADSVYAPAIGQLVNAGVVHGYPDGTFQPEKSIARAEFVTIITGVIAKPGEVDTCMNTADGQGRTPDALFRDVPWNSWCLAPLCVALDHQLVAGYPDHTFRPADPINAASVAKILTRAFDLSVTANAGDTWHAPFMRALIAKGALPSTITDPSDIVTRGQMAQMLTALAYQNAVPAVSQSFMPAQPAPSVPAAVTPSDVDAILTLVNQERTKHGLTALRWNATLARVAQAHAADMVARNFYSHVNPDGLDDLARIKTSGYLTIDMTTCHCTGWSYNAGENITRAATPEEAMTMWMNSPKHRGNILSPDFAEIGVGHAGDLWVQDFGRVTTE